MCWCAFMCVVSMCIGCDFLSIRSLSYKYGSKLNKLYLCVSKKENVWRGKRHIQDVHNSNTSLPSRKAK